MPYFVRTESGVEFGPVSAKELREAARSGTLARRDLVRPNGTVDWFRAERVKGLEFAQKVVAPEVLRDEPIMVLEDPPGALLAPQPSAPAAPTLAGHIEVLAIRGLHVRALAGETVESIILQGAIDALRVSIPAAILGRRGVLVLTDRRAFVVHAGLLGHSIECIYLDQIDRIGFGTRTARHRLLAGAVAVLVGCVILGVPLLRVAWGGALAAPLPVLEATLAFALGGTLIALSRYRALEISVASGSIPFGKAALESDAISALDELRERAVQRSRGVSASAHIS